MRRKPGSYDSILGFIALYGLFIGAGGVVMSITDRNKVGIIVFFIITVGAIGIFIWHDEKDRKLTSNASAVTTNDTALKDSSIPVIPEETVVNKDYYMPKLAYTILEIQGNRKVFKCSNCGYKVSRKSTFCSHCFSILLPLTDAEIGEPIIELYDDATEKIIKAFFDYCAAPALKDPNDTIVIISYVKRDPGKSSIFKGTTLRKWCVDHGKVSLTELDEGKLDESPYWCDSPDGGIRERIFIDFSFDDKVARIGYHFDPLYGYGCKYDYSLDATGKLVLSNEVEEWIS